MAVSSYGNGVKSSGVVRILKDRHHQTSEGRHVVIAEDILDSGLTLQLPPEERCRPATRRPSRWPRCMRKNTPRPGRHRRAAYVGFECPDEFIVGYGLDYAERYRNLPYIGVLKPELYQLEKARQLCRRQQPKTPDPAAQPTGQPSSRLSFSWLVAFFVGQQFMSMSESSQGTTYRSSWSPPSSCRRWSRTACTEVTYTAGDYTVSGTYYPAVTAGRFRRRRVQRRLRRHERPHGDAEGPRTRASRSRGVGTQDTRVPTRSARSTTSPPPTWARQFAGRPDGRSTPRSSTR